MTRTLNPPPRDSNTASDLFRYLGPVIQSWLGVANLGIALTNTQVDDPVNYAGDFANLDVTGTPNLRALRAVAGAHSLTVNSTGITLSSLTVSGAFSAGATTVTTLHATGAVTFDTTLGVTGASTLGVVNAGATTVTTLTTSSTVTLNSNVTIAGTLGVSSATTVTTLHATAAATLDTTLAVTGTTTLGVLSAGATAVTTFNATSTATILGNTIPVFKTGTYSGNNGSNRQVTVGFACKYGFISAVNGTSKVYWHLVSTTAGDTIKTVGTTTASLEAESATNLHGSDGFVVDGGTDASNVSGVTYHYTMFG